METADEISDINRDDTVTPNDFDVLCGRGRGFDHREGNKRFKELVVSNLDRYFEAVMNDEKGQIVLEIVDEIHRNGRFLKVTNGCCYILSDEDAREKVKKAIQDRLRAQRRQRDRPTEAIETNQPENQISSERTHLQQDSYSALRIHQQSTGSLEDPISSQNNQCTAANADHPMRPFLNESLMYRAQETLTRSSLEDPISSQNNQCAAANADHPMRPFYNESLLYQAQETLARSNTEIPHVKLDQSDEVNPVNTWICDSRGAGSSQFTTRTVSTLVVKPSHPALGTNKRQKVASDLQKNEAKLAECEDSLEDLSDEERFTPDMFE